MSHYSYVSRTFEKKNTYIYITKKSNDFIVIVSLFSTINVPVLNDKNLVKNVTYEFHAKKEKNI